MADMTTPLTKFSQNGNSVTYTVTGHTVQKPRLVLQKRKIPSSDSNAVAQLDTSIVYGAVDSAGAVLPSRIMLTVSARRPVSAVSTDVDNAVAVFRDFVASDDFVNAINSQLFAAG